MKLLKQLVFFICIIIILLSIFFYCIYMSARYGFPYFVMWVTCSCLFFFLEKLHAHVLKTINSAIILIFSQHSKTTPCFPIIKSCPSSLLLAVPGVHFMGVLWEHCKTMVKNWSYHHGIIIIIFYLFKEREYLNYHMEKNYHMESIPSCIILFRPNFFTVYHILYILAANPHDAWEWIIILYLWYNV